MGPIEPRERDRILKLWRAQTLERSPDPQFSGPSLVETKAWYPSNIETKFQRHFDKFFSRLSWYTRKPCLAIEGLRANSCVGLAKTDKMNLFRSRIECVYTNVRMA